MDPNPLDATWRLRLGDLRVYYDLDEAAHTVWILRVGVKEREKIVIRGEAVDRRDDERKDGRP
jgi:hypothetical protein